MSEINDHQNDKDRLERLIVRSLDGMLDEDAQLSLDRALIRDPEARQMMDEYRRADELAAAALADLCGAGQDVERTVAIATAGSERTRRGPTRGWLLIPGAIAAAILAMVMPLPTGQTGSQQPEPIVSLSPPQAEVPSLGGHGGVARTPDDGALMQTVGSRPVVRRQAGTEWIGVQGDDGNIYWIEVERSRTIRAPKHTQRDGGTFLEL